MDESQRRRRSSDAADCCPHCGTPSGTLNLLTSMTRYYVCRRCLCRWEASRAGERDQPMRNRVPAMFGRNAE